MQQRNFEPLTKPTPDTYLCLRMTSLHNMFSEVFNQFLSRTKTNLNVTCKPSIIKPNMLILWSWDPVVFMLHPLTTRMS